MTITVKNGQSIFDVVTQYYGDLSYLFKFLLDNNLQVDSDINTNQELLIDETITKNSLVRYFDRESLIVNNSDNILYEPLANELSIKVISIVNEKFGNDGSITIEIKGGILPYYYQWEDENQNIISTQQNLIAQSSGTYSVTVTDGNNDEISIENLVISINDINIYLTDENGELILDESGQPIVVGQEE